jgi:3-oxoadipate enol-lactonase
MSDELSARFTGQADAPVLVLGNSLGTSSRVWDRQAAALGERYRLLHYELPGHGGAASPPGPYSIGWLGRQVLALLDTRGIDQVHYAGVSLGGMIGLWLAANAPDRISSLGLICTSAYLPPAAGWQARAAQVQAAGLASVVEQSVGRWFTPAFIASEPELIASFAADLAGADPAGYAGCCLAIADLDLRPDLARISAPALVISGASDRAIPPEHGALIAAGIPAARHLIVEGAHLANLESAPEVTQALLGQLTQSAERR